MSARGTKGGERQSDRGRSGQDSRGSKNSREQKRYVVSLTGKGLAMSCLLGLVALVWVFIFGVFLGRGMRPENFMPELSRFLPDRKPPPPPSAGGFGGGLGGGLAGGFAGTGPAPAEKTADKAPEKAVATAPSAPGPSAPAPSAPAPGQPAPGLPAEDKEVRRKAAEVAKLVEGQAAPAAPAVQKPAPATTPATTPAPSSPDKKPSESKSQDPKAATAKPGDQKAPEAKPQDAKPQDAKVAAAKTRAADEKTDGRVYEFIYQIGSFEKDKGAEEMKALKAKCKSAGMSTAEEEALVDGKIMKRLRVTHVGTVESSLALKERLAGLGVKNPLLTSKKPL